MSGDSHSNTTIIDTVEKAELMTAISREIERIDRLSASNGYTSWALWAAIGVLGWKALEILEKGVTKELGFAYLFLMVALICTKLAVGILNKEEDRHGRHTYFRTPSRGRAGLLRSAILTVLLTTCIAIQAVNNSAVAGLPFWAPIVFLGLPLVTVLASGFVPKVPIAEGWPAKGAARYSWWIAILWLTLGVVSLWCLLPALNLNNVIRPTDSIKAAVILLVMTVLTLRLARNVQAEERRGVLQRLETELTLSKIGISEARERYENLMLGMNVSVAIRPWIDAVMIPLDEANAGLSEVRQLLHRMKETRAAVSGADGDVLEVAVEQRARALLECVESTVSASNKAHIKLRSVCYAIFGEKDVASSPIAAEGERIVEAQQRVSQSLREVKALLDA